MMKLTVRPITAADIEPLTNYWLDADAAFMQSLGVDISKMPVRHEWEAMLQGQLSTPMEAKKSFAIIWVADDVPVGHSNISPIQHGTDAYMHLHLWKQGLRQKGMGTEFVKMTLPYFFNNFGLRTLYSQPYALNDAPNKTLAKVGFDFVKKYTTTPGWLNFEQEVMLWEMSHDKFKSLYAQAGD